MSDFKTPEVSQPLVSVGVPTYNNPRGLYQTLSGLVRQTWKSLEIIVSDNCSDGAWAEKVVKHFMKNDTRIQYHRQKVTTPSLQNFKFVYQKATSEFFMWAADDDERDPGFIEECMKAILDDEEVVLSFCRLRRKDTNTGRILIEEYNENIGSPSSSPLWRSIIYLYNVHVNCVMYGVFRKKVINNLFFTIIFYGDMIQVLSIIYNGKIHISDKVLFTNGRFGSSHHRNKYHLMCVGKPKKIMVNISAYFLWMYEFFHYIWKEKRYSGFDKAILSFVVIARFLKIRSLRLLAGDVRSLIRDWSKWKFENENKPVQPFNVPGDK